MPSTKKKTFMVKCQKYFWLGVIYFVKENKEEAFPQWVQAGTYDYNFEAISHHPIHLWNCILFSRWSEGLFLFTFSRRFGSNSTTLLGCPSVRHHATGSGPREAIDIHVFILMRGRVRFSPPPPRQVQDLCHLAMFPHCLLLKLTLTLSYWNFTHMSVCGYASQWLITSVSRRQSASGSFSS